MRSSEPQTRLARGNNGTFERAHVRNWESPLCGQSFISLYSEAQFVRSLVCRYILSVLSVKAYIYDC